MTTGATGQLGLALPVQGELSGTWGDTVNNGITQYTNIAIAGTLTLTGDGAVTLTNTTGDASASNITSSLTGAGTVTAQFAIVKIAGTLTTTKVVTFGSVSLAPYSKTFMVVNAATGGTVTFKAYGQTGVSIAVGESAWVYYNGTDIVKVSSTVASGVTTFSAGTTGFTPSTATSGAVTLAGTLATTNGGTGLTSFTSGGAVYASSTSALATGTLPVSAGGTGATTLTANNVILGNGTSAPLFVAPGTSGNVLTSNGTTWTSAAAAATLLGQTDSASPFETSLGYQAGNVATGVNNTFIGYQSGLATTTGEDNTAIGFKALDANTTGLWNVALGTDALGANTTANGNTAIGSYTLRNNITGTTNTAVGYGALINNTVSANTAIGSNSLSANTTGNNNTAIGKDAGGVITTGSQNTIIGSLAGTSGAVALDTGSNNILIGYNCSASSATVSNEVTLGNTSIVSTRLRGIVEHNMAIFEQATVSATAATGTIAYYARSQSVLYYTSNASANWTVNLTGASGVTLDSIMQTGQSMTVAFLVTQGSTAYYNSAVQVDGASVTPKWQGGTAPTAGNASSVDTYVYTVIKTGSATFTVLASQTKFA